MTHITLLDTTLRDGSYAIDFSFTAQDTMRICKTLEEAGIRYIEVGHGVGLGGGRSGHDSPAQETDEVYMIVAHQALHTSKYGMFCIPGIASLSDLDLAHIHHMGFVRIGTNVTEVKTSEPFIRKAKEHGMFVAANYMKSYVMHPDQFAQQVVLSQEYGADMVYIVDSAGGMFPDDLRKYVHAIRKVSDIPLGFHGHDNLGLAIANCLEAAHLGVTFLDASLQGLGRSAGNACLEMLVAVLKKAGYSVPVDLFRLFDTGQKYVQPLLESHGYQPLDIVAGFADFHSSYMSYIQKYASKYHINPVELIVEWCKIDKIHIDEYLLEQLARDMYEKNRDNSVLDHI